VEFLVFNFGLQRSYRVATNPLTDVINQNTARDSQGFPMGVPTSYSWYSGSSGATGSTPPSNFSAVTGWGQIYPEAGTTVDPSASVQIENFQTYVLLTSGAWVLVQNQSTDPISGAHYVADFSGNANVPWKETTSSDGSVSVDAPQSGYNDHFYPGTRGTYAPGTVAGVFVEASMKTSDPNANLVANLGADWWQSSNAPFVSGFANNPGAGMSDWVKLTTSYQDLYFTSLSAAQLQADPPPGLTGSTSATTPPATTPPATTPPVTTPPAVQPAVTQATASPGSGVEHVGTTVALTLDFNEAVTVTGKPTLTLNDGSTATYVSGSGSKALIFDTTVASTNSATSALAVTAANLPSGASIKDASGVSANLSGAVTTFSGVQIDPAATTTPPVTTPPVTTPPVTTPPVTTPPVASDPTAPVLSVADSSLSVQGHGGTVGLGLSVKSSDPNDAVSVEIKGLPRYETITDKLDGRTFRGNDVTLTAAEVDSGLTLHSYHWGSSQPVATLAATATAKDPTTGAVTTSATQTITVKDPPAASTATSTSHANHSFALLNQYLAGGNGQVDHGQLATAASHAASWLNESLLTRPQH
jgi:hypothetical protein